MRSAEDILRTMFWKWHHTVIYRIIRSDKTKTRVSIGLIDALEGAKFGQVYECHCFLVF